MQFKDDPVYRVYMSDEVLRKERAEEVCRFIANIETQKIVAPDNK